MLSRARTSARTSRAERNSLYVADRGPRKTAASPRIRACRNLPRASPSSPLPRRALPLAPGGRGGWLWHVDGRASTARPPRLARRLDVAPARSARSTQRRRRPRRTTGWTVSALGPPTAPSPQSGPRAGGTSHGSRRHAVPAARSRPADRQSWARQLGPDLVVPGRARVGGIAMPECRTSKRRLAPPSEASKSAPRASASPRLCQPCAGPGKHAGEYANTQFDANTHLPANTQGKNAGPAPGRMLRRPYS